MRLALPTLLLACASPLVAQDSAPQTAPNSPVQVSSGPIAFQNGVWQFDRIYVSVKVENAGVASTPVENRITTQATPCSASRACGPTFDLRVRSITPPPAIAAGVTVPVTLTIDNAGKTTSPAVEVALCKGRRGECEGGAIEILTLPELAPGQTATVTHGVTLTSIPDHVDSIYFGAIVDPEKMTTERVRTNNTRIAASGTAIDRPFIEVMDISSLGSAAEPYTIEGSRTPPVRRIRVRNPGRVGATPAVEYTAEVRLYNLNGMTCRSGKGVQRFMLPPVPPRAIGTFTIQLPALFRNCVGAGDGPGQIELETQSRANGADMLVGTYHFRFVRQ